MKARKAERVLTLSDHRAYSAMMVTLFTQDSAWNTTFVVAPAGLWKGCPFGWPEYWGSSALISEAFAMVVECWLGVMEKFD